MSSFSATCRDIGKCGRLIANYKSNTTSRVASNERLFRISHTAGVAYRKMTNCRDDPDNLAESMIGYICVEDINLIANVILAPNETTEYKPMPMLDLVGTWADVLAIRQSETGGPLD